MEQEGLIECSQGNDIEEVNLPFSEIVIPLGKKEEKEKELCHCKCPVCEHGFIIDMTFFRECCPIKIACPNCGFTLKYVKSYCYSGKNNEVKSKPTLKANEVIHVNSKFLEKYPDSKITRDFYSQQSQFVQQQNTRVGGSILKTFAWIIGTIFLLGGCLSSMI